MSHKRDIAIDNSPTYPRHHANGWVGDDLKGQYIHDTKKTPVLPPEEITRLSGLVQEGIAATTQLNDLARVIDVDELEALERTQKIGGDARNDIVTANTGLVFEWASHYSGHNVEYLDLVQAGNLGLIRAAEKFDPSKGFAFSTYAVRWIRSFMSEELHQTRRTIRVPPYQSAQLQKMHGIVSKHENTNREDMSLGQMATAMGKTEEQITELLSWEFEVDSLNREIHVNHFAVNQQEELANHLIDHDAPKVEDVALDKTAEQAIVKAVRSLLEVSTLDERSKKIIRMQFGIGYNKPFTKKEVNSGVAGRWSTIESLSTKAMEQLKAEAELFDMSGLLDE